MQNYLLKLKEISKGTLLLYTGLGLILIYHLVGIFPITRFETDSMAIANACEEMIQSGHFEENVLGHSYHMQSGTYFLIIEFAKLTGLSAFVSYSILTVLFAFLYWLFLVLLLQKITNSKYILIILVLFLFQEIFVLSYYANSAVIASTFWILAFYILWIKNDIVTLIVSALLLSLAVWCRVDVAFTFPSILTLFYMKDRNLKSAILKSVSMALIVVPCTLFLMYLMNAKVSGFLGYTQYHGQLFATALSIGIFDLFVVKAHAAYFSMLLLFLILLSIIFLLRKKIYLPILFLISGILFYYLLGINNAIAPKHLSYYTLFWCIVILFGIKYYKEIKPLTKKMLLSFGIFLFIIQYIIGVKVDIKSVPYQFENYSILNPYPNILSLGVIQLNMTPIKKVEFVLGAGTKISTPDELSASSGIIFSPLMWYKQKKLLYDSFNSLSYLLDTTKADTIYLNVTDGSQYTINNLLSNGFVWKEKKIDFSSEVQNLTFIKSGAPVVKLNRYNVNKNNFEKFIKQFENVNDKNYYFVFIWDWQNYSIRKLNLPNLEILDSHIYLLKNIVAF